MNVTMQWMTGAAGFLAAMIDAMALAIIAIGTVQIFFCCLRAILGQSKTDYELRAAYLRYARWLVAGLTFQLAANIAQTVGTPSWDDVGRLGAVAVIRTFLSFFLERDIEQTRKRLREDGSANPHTAGTAPWTTHL